MTAVEIAQFAKAAFASRRERLIDDEDLRRLTAMVLPGGPFLSGQSPMPKGLGCANGGLRLGEASTVTCPDRHTAETPPATAGTSA